MYRLLAYQRMNCVLRKAIVPSRRGVSSFAQPIGGLVSNSSYADDNARFGAILLLAATSATMVTTTWNEAAETEAPSPAPSAENSQEPVDEEDPYENLPEEDEETSCTLCQTFRQGPCRPFWRKLERCFKDHEEEENGASKCMRYFTPHQKCLIEFSNLYQLISLDMKQDILRDAELAISREERRKWKPKVDWQLWRDFVDEAGLSFSQTIPCKDKKQTPLWKRLQENTEPVLLNLKVPVPRREEESNMILKIAYAVDQDGMVLGLSYNNEYGDLLSKTKSVEKKQEESEEEEENRYDGPFELDFYILPGETKKVKICGMYSEDPTCADPEKEILDVLLYESPRYVLEKLVNKKKE